MSWTYADVDRSEDPVGAAAWMDAMASWPSVREVKQRTLSLLDGCRPVVDIGCGVGEDVRTFGAGAIGLDASLTMLVEARDRGGSFVRGDVHALPVATGSVGGVRTERVLQHVADPFVALTEIARVLRPGGRAVLAEPDQSTLVIGGTDPELTPAIVAFRAASVRNGSLAGELPARLESLGFVDVHSDSVAVEIADPSLAFGLPTWPAMLVERGDWTAEEAARFTASLDGGAFSYRVDCVVAWGTK